MGRLAKRLMGLSANEVTFAERRFRGGNLSIRPYLERVGLCFLEGYHASLLHSDPEQLRSQLEEVDPGMRGFAYEGAAMGLAIFDAILPRSHSFESFFLGGGSGSRHVYMAHVGAGWAMARIPWARRRLMPRLDPLLRWLALDGYGFHQGYFHWPTAVQQQRVPARLTDYERRAFDQGLGRSLWFVDGGDVEHIVNTLGTFASERQTDLWCGIGLSITYAGGVPRDAVRLLRRRAGRYRLALAQGSAFAAEARCRADNLTPHTEMACRVLTGLRAAEAAELTQSTRRDLPADAELPSFEVWKLRIQAQLAELAAVA